VPGIASEVGSLTIFQRSPAWVFGVPGYRNRLGPDREWLLANLPYYAYWLRLRIFSAFADRACLFSEIDPAWRHPDSVSEVNENVRQQLVAYLMEKIGDDPELVSKCLPTYPPMAKRFILDNGWFDALRRNHVELVTDPIERITAAGVATRTGREVPADVLVLATGFHANRYLWPMEIIGRDGLSLADAWRDDGARAYLGITIPRFPNLFCLYGPNTNPRAGNVCTMHELQVRYAMGCLRMLLEGGHRALDVREEVHDAFNRRLDERLRTTIWTDPRQESYYRNAKGRVTTNSPWSLLDYWRFTRAPDPDDYALF
jgi:4-hydroxyacetophenone monooxygenase